MNGLMGKIPNNNNNICPQLMRNYIRWTKQSRTESPLWEQTCGPGRSVRGLTKNTCLTNTPASPCYQLRTCNICRHSINCCMDTPGAQHWSLFRVSRQCRVQAGSVLRAQGDGYGPHSVILASWASRDAATGFMTIDPTAKIRPAVIREIFISTFVLHSGNKRRRVDHLVARLDWFKSHPLRHHFGKGTEEQILR